MILRRFVHFMLCLKHYFESQISAFKGDQRAWKFNQIGVLVYYCRSRLPVYKVPGEVRLLKDLPRNAAGKIDKLTLKERMSPTTSS